MDFFPENTIVRYHSKSEHWNRQSSPYE